MSFKNNHLTFSSLVLFCNLSQLIGDNCPALTVSSVSISNINKSIKSWQVFSTNLCTILHNCSMLKQILWHNTLFLFYSITFSAVMLYRIFILYVWHSKIQSMDIGLSLSETNVMNFYILLCTMLNIGSVFDLACESSINLWFILYLSFCSIYNRYITNICATLMISEYLVV
jgi:hypothetical protein